MKFIYFVVSLFIGVAGYANSIEINAEAPLQNQLYQSYNFGMVWVNSRVSVTYNLRNTGTTPLTYKEAVIKINDNNFTVREGDVLPVHVSIEKIQKNGVLIKDQNGSESALLLNTVKEL